MVLDVLVQSRRDKRKAKRLLRMLLKRQCQAPRVFITDMLASCRTAKLQRLKSPRQAQRFCSAHDRIGTLLRLCRGHGTASEYRAARVRAFGTRTNISGVAAAA